MRKFRKEWKVRYIFRHLYGNCYVYNEEGRRVGQYKVEYNSHEELIDEVSRDIVENKVVYIDYEKGVFKYEYSD